MEVESLKLEFHKAQSTKKKFELQIWRRKEQKKKVNYRFREERNKPK